MLNKNLSRKRKIFEITMKSLMYISILLAISLVLFLVIYIFVSGVPHLSWELIFSSPSYLKEKIGILPDIVNTIILLLTTLIIVLPLGVGAAIYLNEYAKNKRVVRIIEYAAETLSGIPSIIYGLVGMLIFSNHIGTSLLAGSLTLVIMNLPTIMRTTQESLKTVPTSYRDGAFGLGATKFRVIRTVVFPSCIDGIVSGIILSAGRILGESAALLFTAGFAHTLNHGLNALFSPGASLSVALYVYAKEQGEFGVSFAIAAILMLITIIFNLLANYLEKKYKRGIK